MSLKAMADRVRAEQSRARADLLEAEWRNREATARRWKERKRRAFEKAAPVFREAFGRDFSPNRFIYEAGEINDLPCVTVAINYEGKLYAYCRVFESGRNMPYLYARPINTPESDDQRIGWGRDLADDLAQRIVEWGLA